MVKHRREANLWADVQPDMMSEEERMEGDFDIHAPSYRSKLLT